MRALLLSCIAFLLASLGPLHAQEVNPTGGFAYDWNDPTDLDQEARAERDKFEKDFGRIVKEAEAKEAERKRAIEEYQQAQRELAKYRRKRSEDLFKGPDIGAAMLKGFGQGLQQGLGRIQREQKAERRAQQKQEYEELQSRVNYARYRAEQASRPSRSSTTASGNSAAQSRRNNRDSARIKHNQRSSDSLRIIATDHSEEQRRIQEHNRQVKIAARQREEDAARKKVEAEKQAIAKAKTDRESASGFARVAACNGDSECIWGKGSEGATGSTPE